MTGVALFVAPLDFLLDAAWGCLLRGLAFSFFSTEVEISTS